MADAVRDRSLKRRFFLFVPSLELASYIAAERARQQEILLQRGEERFQSPNAGPGEESRNGG